MAQGLLYILSGIIGWIQFLWTPLYLGLSEQNVYAWAVCSNCRASIWLFGSLNILIGIVYIILYFVNKTEFDALTGKGFLFYLIFVFVLDVLTIF